MRVTREQAAENRERIVAAASRLFREKGFDGVGVDAIMDGVGLTHGGFYAHFDSRDALVIEAVTHAMDRSTEKWRKLTEETTPDKRLSKIVNSYLAPDHRDDPGHGCAVPTLAAEIARESAKTRRVFSGRMEQLIDMLAEQYQGLPRKAARKQAMAALATMMGTLVMARVAGNGELSDEILKSGRDAVLGGAGAATKKPVKWAAKPA